MTWHKIFTIKMNSVTFNSLSLTMKGVEASHSPCQRNIQLLRFLSQNKYFLSLLKRCLYPRALQYLYAVFIGSPSLLIDWNFFFFTCDLTWEFKYPWQITPLKKLICEVKNKSQKSVLHSMLPHVIGLLTVRKIQWEVPDACRKHKPHHIDNIV